MWRKGDSSALLAGMQIGAATVESSRKLPEKIKNGIAYDPAIAHLGIYPNCLLYTSDAADEQYIV